MADETDTTAAALAADTRIVDHDAPEAEPKKAEPKGETTEEKVEDDKPEGEGDEPKQEGEDKPRKPSGAQRAKARENWLQSQLAEREREIERLTAAKAPEA